MMNKRNKKGFTLAELLIVVAIIAVLVAIAIPIFNSQLEKAREATDIANARDYYAEIAVALVDGSLYNATGHNSVTVSGNHTATATYDTSGHLTSVAVPGVTVNQRIFNEWSIEDHSVAGVANVTAPVSATATTITYTFTDDGKTSYLSGIAWGEPT